MRYLLLVFILIGCVQEKEDPTRYKMKCEEVDSHLLRCTNSINYEICYILIGNRHIVIDKGGAQRYEASDDKLSCIR
jgi:hypothetical protein